MLYGRSMSTAMLERQETVERRAIARARRIGNRKAEGRAERALEAVCRELDSRAGRNR